MAFRKNQAVIILVAGCLGAVQPQHSFAQQSDARKTVAAAQAYDLGTTEYMNGSYERAAQWFETAHRMAPTAVALLQAVRAHHKAGNLTRAGTLALILTQDYPDQGDITQYADELVKEISAKFLRVVVTCESCTVDLDGALKDSNIFFVDPGETHTLIAHFDSGEVQENIEGEPGEVKSIVLEPPEVVEDPLLDTDEVVDSSPPTDTTSSKKPLSPIYPTVGAGVTAILGGITIWSTINMFRGVDKYEKAALEGSPNAKKLLEKGQSRELRNNILLVSTLVVAAGTAVVAVFFTDWSEWFGEKETQTDFSWGVTPTDDGPYMRVQGRF